MRLDIGGNNFVECVTDLPLVSRVNDATPNDSDKTFTVPDGYLWKLNSMLVTLVTSADVGNRQIVIEAKNELGAIVGRMSAGAVQAASTTRYYSIMQGIYRETSFVNNDIQIPLPMDTYLPAGYSLRVYDSAAIAAAADDMTVGMSIKLFKV